MNYCQNKIKKVLLIGLGGVGTVYANILNNNNVDLRVLVDKNRLEKYKKTPRLLNNKVCNFSYLLNTEEFFPDLVIIATKSNGIEDAIQQIKPFVSKKTFVMSFINGISSEEILTKYFDEKQIIHSYIICHTITRNGNNITHDGVTKVVWGDKFNDPNKIHIIKTFFDKNEINHEISNDILKSLWEKFCFNCCVNQISAIKNYTFEQILNDKDCLTLIKNVSKEINLLANAVGIKDANLVDTTFKNLNLMIPTGKTSMLQDFENARQPEIDLFGGEVLKLAKKYQINVPYNEQLFSSVKEKLTFN